MWYRRSQCFAAFILAVLAASLVIGANPPQSFARLLDSVFRGSDNLGEISGHPLKRPTASGLHPTADADGPNPKQRAQFTIYRNEEGEIVCRAATDEEIKGTAIVVTRRRV